MHVFLGWMIQNNDLPCTNNALEQYFGTARHVEQYITWCRRAISTPVVLGSVCVIFAGLRHADVVAWRMLQKPLEYRHKAVAVNCGFVAMLL